MSTYKVTGRQTLSPDACQISTELAAVQKLMPISADDRETLRESIKRDGIREPLRGYYSPDGDFQILSGVNRLEIARELGLPVIPVEVVEIPQADREAFAIDENRARRQLSYEQKILLGAWVLERQPHLSNNQIAKKAGIDDKTAGKIRQVLEGRSEIPNAGRLRETLKGRSEIPNAESRTDSKGRKQPARKPAKTPPKATGKPESSTTGQSRGQDKGDGEAAATAFYSNLNKALTSVEFESAKSIKALADVAKAWLKVVESGNAQALNKSVNKAKAWLEIVERKHRAAERVK